MNTSLAKVRIITGYELQALYIEQFQTLKPNLSKSTLQKASQCAIHFLKFCQRAKIHFGVWAIESYILSIEKTLSPSNLKQHRAQAKKVNAYAIKKGYTLNFEAWKPQSSLPANDFLELLVNDFLDSVDIGNRSKGTYKTGLFEFASFARTNANFFPLLSKKMVVKFKLKKGLTLSPYTLNSYLASIRQFAKYLSANSHKLQLGEVVEKELIQIASVKNLKLDSNTYCKKGLTAIQETELMQVIEDREHKAIIALMLFGGLRINEVTTIASCDFEVLESRAILRVLGKGRHEKKDFIVISSELQSILDACQSLNFFSNYSTQKIRKIVNGYLIKIGAYEKYKVTCHSLRHTIAQNLIREGKGLESVKMHLRHKSVVSTEKYTNQIATFEYIRNF